MSGVPSGAGQRELERRIAGRGRIRHPLFFDAGMAVELQHRQLHPAKTSQVKRSPLGPVNRSGLEDERRGEPVLVPAPDCRKLAVIGHQDGIARFAFLQGELTLNAGRERKNRASQEHQQPDVGQQKTALPTPPRKADHRGSRDVQGQHAQQGHKPRAFVNVPLGVLVSFCGFEDGGNGEYHGDAHEKNHRQLR